MQVKNKMIFVKNKITIAFTSNSMIFGAYPVLKLCLIFRYMQANFRKDQKR